MFAKKEVVVVVVVVVVSRHFLLKKDENCLLVNETVANCDRGCQKMTIFGVKSFLNGPQRPFLFVKKLMIPARK